MMSNDGVFAHVGLEPIDIIASVHGRESSDVEGLFATCAA